MAQLRDELSKTGGPLERRQVEEYQPHEAGAWHDSLLHLQRRAGNRAVVNLLEGPRLQRASNNGSPAPTPTPETEPSAPSAGPLIVEDDAATVGPGQMRKSEFLEQLRSTVCSTTDAALKEAGQSTEGCPYIEQWLAYYTEQPPAHIERALRKYAPEAATAVTASDYIPAVSNRVRRAVETWVQTGEITGVPEELAGALSGPGGALGAVAGVLGGIGSAIGGAISAIGGAIGGAFSAIGQALFKRKEVRAKSSSEPLQIQAKLTEGQPLDGSAKSRLGAAFGHDFSSVRIHTDGNAAQLSEQLNARAFTIGSDIAFGAGEYQPGTMIGDALIAHELAHVVQQSGGAEHGPLNKDDGGSNESLEEDADVSAVGAVLQTWNGLAGNVKDIGRNAIPRMRSGLRLQRCRRETPVTDQEADTLIRGRYGDNIVKAIAAGVTAVGRVKVVDEATFAANFKRIGGKAIDYPDVAAFVDRTVQPEIVYIHETRQHPATVVHEALHLYQSDKMRDEKIVPPEVKEGITEYFTRQIVEQEKIIERTSYQDEYEGVNELAQIVGDAIIRKAYFEGEIAELEAAVDKARSPGTYHNWSVSMDAGDLRGARSSLKGSN